VAAVTRTYEVRHRTRYTYDDEVRSSYGRACVVPRHAPGQRRLAHRLVVEPGAGHTSESADYYGNTSVYVEVHTPHRVLDVLAVSTVEVTRVAPDLSLLDGWTCERAAADAGSRPDGTQAREMLLESPQVVTSAEVAAYAAVDLTPGRPLGEALTALVSRIHGDFTYRVGATSVTTTIAEVLERREGVCQDFAHLMVGCLRSVGLPARYVSGYLETLPPPGRPRLQGADASHAWVSVLLPQVGWVDLDPTNDQVADARYVVTAWGRDYQDVPPLKGVVFTEATGSTLDVEVDVLRVDGGDG
jgi:transglutaminase-like putative cysteine protease